MLVCHRILFSSPVRNQHRFSSAASSKRAAITGRAKRTPRSTIYNIAGGGPTLSWPRRRHATGDGRSLALANSYDPPSFTLALGNKDVAIATALGRELGVPTRIAELAQAEMTKALRCGWAGRDLPLAPMLIALKRAGVMIEVDRASFEQVPAHWLPVACDGGCARMGVWVKRRPSRQPTWKISIQTGHASDAMLSRTSGTGSCSSATPYRLCCDQSSERRTSLCRPHGELSCRVPVHCRAPVQPN